MTGVHRIHFPAQKISILIGNDEAKWETAEHWCYWANFPELLIPHPWTFLYRLLTVSRQPQGRFWAIRREEQTKIQSDSWGTTLLMRCGQGRRCWWQLRNNQALGAVLEHKRKSRAQNLCVCCGSGYSPAGLILETTLPLGALRASGAPQRSLPPF